MGQDAFTRQILYNLFERSLYEMFSNRTVMKGQEYWELGHVLAVKMNGLEIRARVSGKYLPEYRVTIDLSQGRAYLSNTCTCPVGGDCKHVVATLLMVRNQWRTVIENKLQKLINNPLGLSLKEISAVRKHDVEIYEKFNAYYDKYGANQFISDLLGFFRKNPRIFPTFIEFLSESAAELSKRDSLSSLEAVNEKIAALLSQFEEELKIMCASEDIYPCIEYEYKDDETFSWISAELLEEFDVIRGELSKVHLSLHEMWPLWNRIFLWWTNTIYRTLCALADKMGIGNWEELADFIYLPLHAFLFDFFNVCWQNSATITSNLVKDIISALDSLITRYPNVDPNWMIAILLTFKLNNISFQGLKTQFPSEALKKDIEYVETEPTENILVILGDLFIINTTMEGYISLVKNHPQYGKKKDILYQIIVDALDRDWYEFNDLFVQLFELKDLKKDGELLKDLLRLYKRTHSLEIIRETLTRIDMRGDSELKELAIAKFIKAAKRFEPMEYISVLIACNQKQKAATVFYNKIYPRFMKNPTFALFSEAFLVEILPQIMEYNPNKTENLLSTLIEVHISRKNRVDYKMAAILARLLKKLYIDVKKNEQLWKTYITDLLQRYRRLSALKAEMRNILDESD